MELWEDVATREQISEAWFGLQAVAMVSHTSEENTSKRQNLKTKEIHSAEQNKLQLTSVSRREISSRSRKVSARRSMPRIVTSAFCVRHRRSKQQTQHERVFAVTFDSWRERVGAAIHEQRIDTVLSTYRGAVTESR